MHDNHRDTKMFLCTCGCHAFYMGTHMNNVVAKVSLMHTVYMYMKKINIDSHKPSQPNMTVQNFTMF